jgi:hypothetical protein
MNDLILSSEEILTSCNYTTERVEVDGNVMLVFEDVTTIGFLFGYKTTSELVARWEGDSATAISRYSMALKRAGQKAWNTYVILLSSEKTDYAATVALATIEENLIGTRKVARAGIVDTSDLRNALLILLPLQSAPRLEAVDLPAEIRGRTTDLNPRAVSAFLSQVDTSIVLQILEEAP